MTLPASGAIDLIQIADEFALPHNSVFPTDFYSKGGAPASGALSFADFYGRSNGFVVTVPNSVFASDTNTTITTAPVTATISGGGVAPFTHSWAKTLGDAITAVNPTLATTTFRATGLGSPEDRSATFVDTVTDANGVVIDSNDIEVIIQRM